MAQFFEVRATYYKVCDNGKAKKVTSAYIVDALSCTEAEAEAVKYLSEYVGEFTVLQVKRTNYSEVFSYGKDKWYSVKYNLTDVQDDGKEKRVTNLMLVNAENFDSAINTFENEVMKGVVTDYEAVAVAETGIVDVLNVEEQ